MSIPKRNPQGYMDLTAHKALSNIERNSRGKAKKVIPSEAEEQATLIEWAAQHKRKYPELWFLFAIPNGGSRHRVEARNLQRQGVKAGVSDLFLSVARRGCHGLYIEMKRKSRYKLQDNQTEWINRVREQGYAAFFCYGADDAIEKLEWYLGGEPT